MASPFHETPPIPPKVSFVERPLRLTRGNSTVLPPLKDARRPAPSRPPLTRSKSLRFTVVWRSTGNGMGPSGFDLESLEPAKVFLSLFLSILAPILTIFALLLIPFEDPNDGILSNFGYCWLFLGMSNILLGGVLGVWVTFVSGFMELKAKTMGLLGMTAVGGAVLGTVVFSAVATLSFPTPAGPVLASVPVGVSLLPTYWILKRDKCAPEDFTRKYFWAVISVSVIGLEMLCIVAFIFFFADVDEAIQAIMGFCFPFNGFLFRWVGTRISKFIQGDNTVMILPTVWLGMLSSSFYPIFFFPFTIGWLEYLPQLAALVVMETTYLVRLSEFWYRFSGNDRKKLYVVSEAQDKLLEYRQRVVLEFLFFNLTEITSLIAYLCYSPWIRFGWNRTFTPLHLVSPTQWGWSLVYTGLHLGASVMTVTGVSVVLAKHRNFGRSFFASWVGWMQLHPFLLPLGIAFALLVPYQMLFTHSKSLPADSILAL